MIIESRRYRLHPGKLPEYLACLSSPAVFDLLRPRMAAFWVAESGELNTVHHLWRYESRADRAAVRADWASLPAMVQLLASVTPMLQQQHSDVFGGEVLEPPSVTAAGVFDRISVRFQPQAGAAAEDLASFLDQCVAAPFARVATLRRYQFESAGPLRELQLVLRSESLAQRDARWRSVDAEVCTLAASPLLESLDSQLLMPAPFSPWR